jgi:hypothetical protein
MSLYTACHPVLEGARARQREPSVPVWDLEYHGWPWGAGWRAFPSRQEAVLRAFLAEAPECYLQMDPSDVLDWPPSMEWTRPYKNTFQLPAGLQAAALTKAVLYTGGYWLYCAPAPVEPLHLAIDAWRIPSRVLVSTVADLGITACIIAHHDNDSWRIVFPSETSPTGR